MRHLLFISTLTVLLFAAIGCNKQSYPTALLVADSLMSTSPDSALAILDKMEGEMKAAPMAVRMRHQLLRHKAMNKAYIPFTTDSVMLNVVNYYDTHGTANERMESHYLLASVYRDMGDAPKALATFHDAADCADTLSADCDFALLSRVYGQTATLLHKMQLPYELLEETELAMKYAFKAKDTIMAISGKMLRANAYRLLGNTDSVMAICEEASNAYLLQGDTLYSLISLKPAIGVCMDRNNLEAAKSYFDKYKLLESHESNNLVRLSHKNYDVIKSRYYLLVNQIDSAKYYLDKARSLNLVPNEEIVLYKWLAEYYKTLGQSDSTLKYAEKYVEMDDTLYRQSVREDFQKMHTLYNYEHAQRQAEHKEHELTELKSRMLTFALLLLIASVLLALYLIRKRQKTNAILRSLNTKYAESLEQYSKIKKETELLEQSKEANELLIEQLQQEKDKNAETISRLSHNVEKNAATIKDNKERLKKQEYIIASFQKDKVKPDQWNMEERLFNLPLLTRLHSNIAIGKQPSDGQLVEVREMMDNMLPEFIPSIQELYPQINHTNLLFCIFTKLRFINSERAVIFNMSSQAVTNRSAFLYNKLTGKKGGAGDFEKEIQKL